jgi:hypothetical protein
MMMEQSLRLVFVIREARESLNQSSEQLKAIRTRGKEMKNDDQFAMLKKAREALKHTLDDLDAHQVATSSKTLIVGEKEKKELELILKEGHKLFQEYLNDSNKLKPTASKMPNLPRQKAPLKPQQADPPMGHDYLVKYSRPQSIEHNYERGKVSLTHEEADQYAKCKEEELSGMILQLGSVTGTSEEKKTKLAEGLVWLTRQKDEFSAHSRDYDPILHSDEIRGIQEKKIDPNHVTDEYLMRMAQKCWGFISKVNEISTSIQSQIDCLNKSPTTEKTCPKCEKTFANKYVRIDHEKKCTGSKVKDLKKDRECPKCKKIFTTTYIRASHEKKCKGPKDTGLICRECKIKFANRWNLGRHVEICSATICALDHEHKLVKKCFSSIKEAKTYILENKLDAEFKISTSSSGDNPRVRYECSRRGVYVTHTNIKSKKNMECSSKINIFTNSNGQVIMRGCLTHDHPLDQFALMVPEVTKMALASYLEMGIPKAIILEKYCDTSELEKPIIMEDLIR